MSIASLFVWNLKSFGVNMLVKTKVHVIIETDSTSGANLSGESQALIFEGLIFGVHALYILSGSTLGDLFHML